MTIGLGVLAIMLVGESVSPRFPGALIGLCLAGLATVTLGLEGKGVGTLGSIAGVAPHLSLPAIDWDDFHVVAPLAVLIALVVVVQTAATTRSFPNSAEGPDVNRDFIGVGVANAFAGLLGAFPVDASPPSTAVAAEAGCRSQLAGLLSAAAAVCVLLFASKALAHLPSAALGGRPPLRRDPSRACWRDGRCVEAKPSRVFADPRDRACHCGAADRAGGGRRRAAVGAAWRLDDDTRPGDRT